MNVIRCSLILATLCSLLLGASLLAVEPGFVQLLDRAHTEGWRMCGDGGGTSVKDGILTIEPKKNFGAYYWYAQSQFTDFTIKLEFKINSKEGNSGVAVRFPFPGENKNVPNNNEDHYHIDVSDDPDPLQATGAIAYVKAPSSLPQKKGDWNELEITVVRQIYVVKVNGLLVNEFVGNRSTAGFFGIQVGRKGIQFRNIRIKDLASRAIISPPLATIQSDPSQPRIEVIKDQGPNATEWALRPLDEAIPSDIRQNLTFLREDLLDEGTQAPQANPEAYKQASDYCDKLLAALNQRELARVQAGYRGAQAEANKATSNQALDARRNYKMSWPQYAREESQRSALRENESDKADVKKERIKVEWAGRSAQMRGYLDDVYAKFREALRQSPVAK